MLALGIVLLAGWLFPPPPPPKQPPAPAQAKNKVEPKKGNVAQKGAPQEGAPKEAAPVQVNEQAAAPHPQPAGKATELPAIAPAGAPAQYVTLGSLDPKSGYRMLITLTNRGAAVVQAEMSSPRYRDQDDWTGYLGDLELKAVPGGVQVQVVGPGTPAADAKIAVGDVIVGLTDVNKKKVDIKAPDDFRRALAKTKPGQQITLQVRHGNNGPQARQVHLMRRPFAVVRPEIDNYRMREVDPPADFVDRPSFLLTLSELNGKPLGKNDAKRMAGLLETGNWKLAAHDEKSAIFERDFPELKLRLLKHYTIATAPAEARNEPDFPAYHLYLDIELQDTDRADSKAPPRKVAYRLDGPTGMPMEGWWYSRKVSRNWSSSVRDVEVRFVGSSVSEISNSSIAKGKVEPMEGKTLAYACVDGQYFSAVMIPQLSGLEDSWFLKTEAVIVDTKPDEKNSMYANVTPRMYRKTISLDAGATHHDSYQIFLGPKRPDLLSAYYLKSAQWAGDATYSLKDLIYYGWFSSVARVMLVILHFVYFIVRNYGIAIILLTLVVRGAMFPISYKQTQNMAKMQALKPEMDRINEKYKDDMQKKSQATQELYRKNKINPLGGCLPLLIQTPIFIGLYRALMVDVELRQAPMFGSHIQWCSNLSAPDMFLNWSNVMPNFITHGILGPYLNIFPIVTIVVMLITQKMAMPPAASDQAALQQKMMKYMMIFIGFMYYRVASGLCLYLIFSSAWSIAERKLLPKTQTAGAAASGDTSGPAAPSGGKRPRSSGPNGSAGPKKPRKAKRKR
ncbi:MAG TPA: YidC/Oxa1 family insertase periplasmic-domain containing protein [Lacipirellulaceae bacterium]|nr:YidC/Oxa1 family insertase periplasmic-domain containing protein [Lacipirellulaceae bacterium]